MFRNLTLVNIFECGIWSRFCGPLHVTVLRSEVKKCDLNSHRFVHKSSKIDDEHNKITAKLNEQLLSMRKKNSTRLTNTSRYISKEDLSEKCTDVINVFDSEQPVGDDEELQERLFELHEVGRTRRSGGGILSNSVNKELRANIVADNPNLTYVLKQALVEIERIESERNEPLMIPQNLSLDEWRCLISLTDYRSRVTYLHSLVHGKPSLQNILKLDKVYREPLKFNEKEIQEMVGDDKEAERNIKIFLNFHELERQDGNLVPYEFDLRDWKEISKLKHRSQRYQFLELVLKRELNQFHTKLRRIDSKTIKDEMIAVKGKPAIGENHIMYGINENTIHLQLDKRCIYAHYDWIALREFNSWGIPLVIDLSFHRKYKISKLEKRTLLSELILAYENNRTFREPFQLHITGVDDDTKSALIKEQGDFTSANITSQSHLDMFPVEKLVYLSPDSKNDLISFKSDDIYVIGGIVDDEKNRAPLTLSAAKKMNIRHARFPLRQVLGMQFDLNIDTCVTILNDIKATNDWFYAMRWIPPRLMKSRIYRRRNSVKIDHQLIYRAHSWLYPNTTKGEEIAIRNLNLTPKQYRHYYRKLLECKNREQLMQILEEIKTVYHIL